MGRILAIDFGLKRCGIAVTDELQLIASGLDTVNTMDMIEYLAEYLYAHDVETIVIGQPRQMDGSPSEIEPEILKFIDAVEDCLPGWPIERFDERFTSKMAFQSMIDGGLSKKKRRDKGLIDEISATIILQDYLNKRNTT